MSGKKKHVLWQILLVFCITLFALSLVMLGIYLFPTLRPIVESPSSPPQVSAPADTDKPEPLPDNPIDFAAQRKLNSHIIAWIRVPGTVIDYPVLQSGNGYGDNFYLTHDVNRQEHRAGSIYIQQMNRPDFTHPNTVLYGHNMANGSMFADLHQFRKTEFFNENEYIYVYTPGHILTYRIFAAFMYDDRHILNSFNFADPSEYSVFLEQSLHPTSLTRQVREGVNVTTADRIITLSTCAARKSDRYLVEGVLIDDQPTK